ncbi:MAG TPA: hypothetical protein VG125_05965 [Pirellulales bacterium]|jgi:hypothetical protein|nr:hypothetical protein [Pirellulales bacterium]
MASRERPFVDFGDLLCRLSEPGEPCARNLKPLVASAFEIGDEGSTGRPRQWVILHSVTSSGLQIIHSQHLQSKKLAVRIESPTGEVIRVLVSVTSTDSRGELYETSAVFGTYD